MRRFVHPAGVAAVVAALGLAGLGAAQARVPGPPQPAASARAALLDEGGRTPVARAGSDAAARGGIGKRELRRTLRRELDRAGGGSGAYVSDLDAARKRDLFADSAGTARLLASNTKLFTTAAFLDRFGAGGRLTTAVYERGKRTGGRQRTLKGSLSLVGDGDPALASSGFADRNNLPLTSLSPLARAVKAAGIRRVKGNVRADETIFDGRRSVPQPGITGGPYLSPLSGLSFDSGFEDGRYAADPAANAGRALVAKLRDIGVRVTGAVRVGRTPRSLLDHQPLGTVASPTAATLARQTNAPSDNFFAEMLLKRLGAGPSKQGTTARGSKRAERFARKAGSGVRMHNGSGLSRHNAASPRQVTDLLTHMHRNRDTSEAFFDSLAIAGRTGTLSGRMRGTAAEGRCHGKTGTLSGVSVLSGYCRTGGDTVAFSILMNNVNLDTARQAQDAMVAAIARYG